MNGFRTWRDARRALMAIVLVAPVQGCGHGAADSAPEDTTSSAQPLGTIICGSFPSTDEFGNATEQPEYYRLTSINRTLRTFPDFASSIGMKSVRSCDQARAFTRAYDDYFQAHPYFDSAMTFDPKVELPVLPPGPATVIVPKVFNGTPMGPHTPDLFPVVRITPLLPAGAKWLNDAAIPGAGRTTGVGSCTGTFIAKNFILTAAHCFEAVALQYPEGTPAGDEWITGALWRIEFPSPSGKVSASGGGALTLEVNAVTIAHPQFSSITNRNYDPGHLISSEYDLGLIFIPPTDNDGDLPPDVSKSAWDVQIAPVTSTLIQTAFLGVYGYGATAEDGTNATVLNVNFNKPVTQFSANAFTLVSIWPTNPTSSQLAICRGDSGGPMFRQVSNGHGGFDTIIIAINSGASGRLCGAGFNDAGAPNESVWSRVDVVATDWLKDTLQFFKMGPAWSPHILTEGGFPSYAEMHGAACHTDCDCLAGEFCDNSINNASSPYSATRHAQSCGGCQQPPIGDCACQLGQCLPLPAGADAGLCPR
jgi:hypothetical protein